MPAYLITILMHDFTFDRDFNFKGAHMNQTFVNQTFVNHVVEFRKLFVYIVFTSYCINIYIANLLDVYIHVKTNVYWITSKVFSLKENHCFCWNWHIYV